MVSPRRHTTESRDATTEVESAPFSRPPPPEPTTPDPSSSPRRRGHARVAVGSSNPPNAISLRRPPPAKELDGLVAGLLGRARAASGRAPRLERELPPPMNARPEGTSETLSSPPTPDLPPSRRVLWFVLAFVAGGGVATAIALALS